MNSFLEFTKWFALGLLVILIGYIVIRVFTKAFFTSYFEGKVMFFLKKDVGTIITKELKDKLKEKEK